VKLDRRLNEILSHITGQSFADVGCDHGKLAVKAIECGYVNKVIATDISVPSLDKTIRLADSLDLSQNIICRVGDGLSVMKNGEVDTVVIAGLGGDEIAKILQNAKAEGKEFHRFVLSPNTHAERVRAEAIVQGLGFVRDYLILSDRKFYSIIVLEKEAKKKIPNQKQFEFGMEYAECEDFRVWANNELSRLATLIKNTKNNEQLKIRLQQIKDAYEDNKCE